MCAEIPHVEDHHRLVFRMTLVAHCGISLHGKNTARWWSNAAAVSACAENTAYLVVVGVLQEMPRHVNIHCVIEIMTITYGIRRRRPRKTENLYLHICIYLAHPNVHAIVNPSRIPESLADLDFLPS